MGKINEMVEGKEVAKRSEEEIGKDIEYLAANLNEMNVISKFLELNLEQLKVNIEDFSKGLEGCKKELEELNK